MTMTKFSRINKQREEITMRVLEDMEKGGNEWKKPWVEASPLPPHNPVSGTQYSGRNFLYTYVYGMMRGYYCHLHLQRISATQTETSST